MLISDWSSDVCSSDLFVAAIRAPKAAERQQENRLRSAGRVESDSIPAPKATQIHADNAPIATPPKLTVIEGGKDAAELDAVPAQLAAVTAERDELTERLAEMSGDLASYMQACEGNDAEVLEIQPMTALLHPVERQRANQTIGRA